MNIIRDIDVSDLLIGARFVGDQAAVHLGTGRAIVTPEFWNLPPETYVGEDPSTLPEPVANELKARHAMFHSLHLKLVEVRGAPVEKLVSGEPAGVTEGTGDMPEAETLKATVVPIPEISYGSEDKKEGK